MIASDSHTHLHNLAVAAPRSASTPRRLQLRRSIARVRHASPPPGVSARAVLVILLLADVGYLLMALDVGLLGGR